MCYLQTQIRTPLRTHDFELAQMGQIYLDAQHGPFFYLAQLGRMVAPCIFSHNAKRHAGYPFGLPHHLPLRQHARGLLSVCTVGL